MDHNLLSICFVSQEYPEETNWGGVGTYVYESAHGLAKAGHRVTVLTRALESPKHYSEEDGVEVIRILPKWSLSKVPLFWRSNRVWEGYRLAVADALSAIVKSHSIHVIESPDLNSELFLFSLIRWHRPPFVVRLHSGNHILDQSKNGYFVKKGLDRAAERVTLRLASAITSPSSAAIRQRNPAFPLPKKECVVIPNPVNTGVFRPLESVHPKGDLEILYLGRMEAIKGVDILIKAIPMICQSVPEARFTLIGAGMGKSNTLSADKVLESQLPRQFLDRIRLLSHVERKKTPEIYARASVCVIPSRWEQFGYTCAEAMACGKAVVASNAGGLAEIVEDKVSGILVEPENPQKLAEAVIDLLRDTKQREALGKAARERIERLFSTDVVIPKMAEFYRKVIGR